MLENLNTTEDDNTENIYEETEPFATSDETHDETNEADTPTEILNPNTQAGLSNTTSQTQFKAPTHTVKNNKRKAVDVAEKRMDEAYKLLKTVVNTEKPKQSLCQLYGQLVAEKLEAFDKMDRIVVMNDIDNLLFRATLRHMEKRSQQQHPTNNLPQQYPSRTNQMSYLNNRTSISTEQPTFTTFTQLSAIDAAPPIHTLVRQASLAQPDSQVSQAYSSSESYESHSSSDRSYDPSLSRPSSTLSLNYYPSPEYQIEANSATAPQERNSFVPTPQSSPY